MTRDQPPIEVGTELLIGRNPSASGSTFCVRDTRVSSKHLRIVRDPRDQRLRCADAGSRNGVFVNLERRQGSWLAAAGDVVRIGDTLLLFENSRAAVDRDRLLARAARSDVTVLLLGETGVGKEVAARRLHETSGRPGPLIAVNCAALPRELLAAELFGHARGAFSGAIQARNGLFVAAAGGTLLLDEIGDIGPEAQSALLRVIEERRVRPLGTTQDVPVDVRLLAATHRDLLETDGFRQDLYARLAELVVRVPPLRERRGEILLLIQTFLSELGRAGSTIEPDAAEALVTWSWPLNVREVRAMIKAFVAVEAPDAALDMAALTRVVPAIAEAWESATCERYEKVTPHSDAGQLEVEKLRGDLEAALFACKGNVKHAAARLSRPRSYVYRWLQTFGLRAEDFRDKKQRT